MFILIKKQLIISILIILTAIIGDNLVKNHFGCYAAVFDNLTHAIIGGLSWTLVATSLKASTNTWDTTLEILICTLISSWIDLDHFIEAKSIYLKDATNLSKRPFLHSSTQPLIAVVVFIALSFWWKSHRLQKFAFIIFVSFGTHHTRDATRRGFWFALFGNTKPIPYVVYLVVTVLIPFVAIWGLQLISSRNFVVNYNLLEANTEIV